MLWSECHLPAQRQPCCCGHSARQRQRRLSDHEIPSRTVLCWDGPQVLHGHPLCQLRSPLNRTAAGWETERDQRQRDYPLPPLLKAQGEFVNQTRLSPGNVREGPPAGPSGPLDWLENRLAQAGCTCKPTPRSQHLPLDPAIPPSLATRHKARCCSDRPACDRGKTAKLMRKPE